MTADMTRGSPHTPLERPAASIVVRWLLGTFFVVLGLALLAIFAAAIFAFRWWAENRVAAKAVEQEVARLRMAGEPMTAEDLYRFHAVPENVADTTPAWLAAQKSCNAAQLYQDGKGLPFVGDGKAPPLRADAESQLRAAEEFLALYDSALQAILAAAGQPGECRYPVKFEDGVSLAANDVQGVRTLVRLLALNVQVKAIRGKSDEALESLAAMFAASDTISHQLTIVEQLVRLPTLGMAMQQTEFAINEMELTDDQLTRIAQQLEICDIRSGFTRSLIGERALGHESFKQMGIAMMGVERQRHLDILTQAIASSAQPPPADRNQLNAMIAKLQAQQAAASPWSTRKQSLTAGLQSSLTASFNAKTKVLAWREALLAAIAAERYRLKTGQFPSQLTDLVPDYLPAVPFDPFDGQPIRIRQTGNEILVYSVGLDGKDDGASNPPGISYEPDIVARVSSVKAGK